MNDQSIRFRFGIFVLASLILMAVLTILFGGFPNYFKKTNTYTILFNNIQGISPGTPVRRSGVNIGDVRDVMLENETGKVKVVIRVDEKYTLRKGDRPTIMQGLIGGDASIAILPPEGKNAADFEVLEPGSIMMGVNAPDPGAVLQKTADLVRPAQETLEEVRKVFVRLDQMMPDLQETLKEFREVGKLARDVGPDMKKTSEDIRTLSRTWNKVGERTDDLLKKNEDKITRLLDRADDTMKRLNEAFNDENQKNLREALKNVNNGTQQLEKMVKNADVLIGETRVTVKQMSEAIKKADDALTDLQKATKPFGDRGPQVFKNLEEGTDSLNKTMKDLRELMQVIARSDGTVQRLLSDPSLYNNLNDSAEMATKLFPRMDRILHDVEIFADRLARHPELIGLGGVLRPSSGIKENTHTVPYRIYPLP